jgi:hypothetical protein
MLNVYLDESFDETTGMYFVAGFAGSKSQWREFVPRWRAVLASYNRTSLHMVNLRLGSKAGLRHGELLNRLGKIPPECGLTPVAGSICTAEYRHRLKGNALQILMEGYVLATVALLDGLGACVAPEQVKIYFEELPRHTEQRRRAMQFWKARNRVPSGWSVIAEWDVIPKRIQLEAADYLCFAMQHRNTNRDSQKARLTASILTEPCIWNHTGKEVIERWFDYFDNRRGRPIPLLTKDVKKVLRTPHPHQ